MRNYHTKFLKKVLKHRSQDMASVNGRFTDFHVRRRSSSKLQKNSPNFTFAAAVTFDEVSKVHLFSKRCITSAYQHIRLDSPPLVYSSFPKLGSKISTKRTVLGKVKLEINHELEQYIL